MVITPKYRGKILVGEVGLVTEAIIRKTCNPTLTVKKSNSSSMFTILAGKPI